MNLVSGVSSLDSKMPELLPVHNAQPQNDASIRDDLPFVSVVIPTCNRWHTLKETLAALCAQDYRGAYEIILVDDCSDDSSEVQIRQYALSVPVPIRYFRNQIRLGPGGSRNVGIGEAGGNIIALTDSDTIPQPHWISSGVRPFLECDSVAGVEGSVIPLEEASIGPFADVIHNRRGGRYQCCSMFYRKSAIEQAGGFDERLFDRESGVHFREDLDIALAVMQNGGTIHFQAEAAVFHPAHRPYFRRPIDLMRRYIHDPLMMRKYRGPWRRCIDPLRVGPIEVSMPRHKLYAVYLGFAVMLAVGVFVSNRWMLLAALYGESLAAVCVLSLHWRLCKKPSLASILLSVPMILLCPYAFAYSFAKGWLRVRKLLREA